MKFKMRVLYQEGSANAEKVANAIAKEQQANVDKIPPAYPVENERLLFVGAELKGSSADKAVTALCTDLRPDRVKNVAFFAVSSGSFDAINELKKIVTGKGINVIDDVCQLTVKGGLFKKGPVSDEDVKKATAWADKVTDSLVGA